MKVIYEESVGTDTSTIGYPGVSTCTTVTCSVANGTLVGAHFSCGTPPDKFRRMLASMKTAFNGGAVDAIYVIGAFDYWGNPSGGTDYKWPQMFRSFRTVLGTTAPVYCFNSAKAFKDSTFQLTRAAGQFPSVEIASQASCSIPPGSGSAGPITFGPTRVLGKNEFAVEL